MSQDAIMEKLVWFDAAESKYLAMARDKHLTLPDRLKEWRLWINDPVIYINELRNFVEMNP